MRDLLDNIDMRLFSALLKRAADMLEKLGIASLIWGLFQSVYYGYAIAAASIFLSFYLTYKAGAGGEK